MVVEAATVAETEESMSVEYDLEVWAEESAMVSSTLLEIGLIACFLDGVL